MNSGVELMLIAAIPVLIVLAVLIADAQTNIERLKMRIDELEERLRDKA
jgi:hypothetical protein